jgi:hypothetical protein
MSTSRCSSARPRAVLAWSAKVCCRAAVYVLQRVSRAVLPCVLLRALAAVAWCGSACERVEVARELLHPPLWCALSIAHGAVATTLMLLL